MVAGTEQWFGSSVVFQESSHGKHDLKIWWSWEIQDSQLVNQRSGKLKPETYAGSFGRGTATENLKEGNKCPMSRNQVPMTRISDWSGLRTAAIVCGEIAIDRVPILYAERSAPDEDVDSGWQFLCGAGNEDPKKAQVWALGDVVDYDHSLAPYIEMPVGTVLSRSSPTEPWSISRVK